MRDPEQQHVEAQHPAGITYIQLAQLLGMTRGTLGRKLTEFNRRARKEGTPEIKPDSIERHRTYSKHLFNTDRLPDIRAALKSLPAARRGRPKNPKH